MEREVQKTMDALSKLPPPPSSNPLQEILALLNDFARTVTQHVTGIPEQNGIIQKVRHAQDGFRGSILSTAPDFRPYERKQQRAVGAWPPPNFLDIADGQNEAGRTIYIDQVYHRALE